MMTAETIRLSMSERKRLNEFLKSADSTQLPLPHSYLFAGILALIGLFLFVATTVITLNSLNEVANLGNIGIWMLLSGLLGGAVIVAVGLSFLMYAQNSENRKKLGTIVQKLLNETG
jgi:hypothetical protein